MQRVLLITGLALSLTGAANASTTDMSKGIATDLGLLTTAFDQADPATPTLDLKGSTDMQMARRGRGADDGPGDDHGRRHGGHGADDPAGGGGDDDGTPDQGSGDA